MPIKNYADNAIAAWFMKMNFFQRAATVQKINSSTADRLVFRDKFHDGPLNTER